MDCNLLHNLVAAEPRGGYRLFLRFDDGTEGEIDLKRILGEFTGVFAPLADPAYVARVAVRLGTAAWPNNADIAPETLYCAVRGIPVPAYEETPRKARHSRPVRRGRAGRAKRTRVSGRRPARQAASKGAARPRRRARKAG